MKLKSSKLLSIILTVALVFSCLAVGFTANAEYNILNQTDSPVALDGGLPTSVNESSAPMEGDYKYTVSSGTIGEAINTAIKDGCKDGSTVVFDVKGNLNFGELPQYRFNLIINGVNHPTLTATNCDIAKNPAFTTTFNNVAIKCDGNGYSHVDLNGSNAVFASNSEFTSISYNSLILGTATASTTAVVSQTVEINCPIYRYINLSNWTRGNVTREADVNLIINNKDANVDLRFTPLEKGPNGAAYGTATYNGNININVKSATKITLNQGVATAPEHIVMASDKHLNFIVGVDVTFDYDTQLVPYAKNITAFKKTSAGDKINCIIDKTFIGDVADFTDTAGTYKITCEDKVTAQRVKEFNGTAFSSVVSSKSVSSNGKLVLNQSKSGIWEIINTTYFEDFNDVTSIDDLHKKGWTFTSDSSTFATKVSTVLKDGKLTFGSCNNAREVGAVFNINKRLNAKDQYISFDYQFTDVGLFNGIAVLGRLGSDGNKFKSYELMVNGNSVQLHKIAGGDRSDGGYFPYNTDGLETNGLMEYRPYSTDASKNELNMNGNHTYRVAVSFVTDYDRNGKEVALIRCVLLDITSNALMFDETFRDTEPYNGTGLGFTSQRKSSGAATYTIDNLYFSNEKLRDSDAYWKKGDLNGDSVYDIRDLVAATADTITMRYKADRNSSGTVDSSDLKAIAKEILNNAPLTTPDEFSYTGYTDEEADITRQNILNSTSQLNKSGSTLTYVSSATVRDATASGGYKTINTLTKENCKPIYVASSGSDTGNGDTTDNPVSIKGLLKLMKSSSTFTTRNAILFKRGDTFRFEQSGLMNSGNSALLIPGGVLVGAYGTGEKPVLKCSQKDYSKVKWTKVAAQDGNVWVIDAPEIIIDNPLHDVGNDGKYATENGATNIMFDTDSKKRGYEKVGLRKGFPVGLDVNKEKLYTLYKDGDYTYDTSTGKLYLYSLVDPSTYDDIEICRSVTGISLTQHKSDFTVDNLNIEGFGRMGIQGSYGNSNLTVTNCEIGFAGGLCNNNSPEKVSRYGNGIELWCGRQNMKVKYNWIYQTFDSAISPQGNQGFDFTGFEVVGNLLEYNNCDIEIFDGGSSSSTGSKAKWDSVVWSNNIMRFTSLGWGSRNACRIRNIQGVMRGGVSGSCCASIDWIYNTVDTPTMEIARFKNVTEYNGDTPIGIFFFGTAYKSSDPSIVGNNKYYFNPYVRSRDIGVWEYCSMLPSEYQKKYGKTEETRKNITDIESYKTAIRTFDTAENSELYYLGKKVN